MLPLLPAGAGILGFLGSVFPQIMGFFIWIGKKLSVKYLIMPVQWAFLGSLVVLKISIYALFISFVLWIYNQIKVVLSFINSFPIQNEILSTAVSVLKSIGLFSAFNDVFSTFSFVFVSLLVLIISQHTAKTLKSFSDEYFKIGMLMQG